MPEVFKCSVREMRWGDRVCENNPQPNENIRREIRWIPQEMLNRVVNNFNFPVCYCALCVCVFMLFHLLVSSGCTASVIYVRSSDQRSFVVSIFWVLLPSSFISISESILFHLQRRKLQPSAYWRENDMI